MNVVLALRFVERSVAVDATTSRLVRVLQQRTGDMEVSQMTNGLVCRTWADWHDVPLEPEGA